MTCDRMAHRCFQHFFFCAFEAQSANRCHSVVTTNQSIFFAGLTWCYLLLEMSGKLQFVARSADQSPLRATTN